MMIQATTTENITSRQDNLLWLRANALNRLIVAGVAIGFLWYAYLGIVVEISVVHTWGSPVALVVFGLLASRAVKGWGLLPAVTIYIAGMVLAVTAGAWAYDEPYLLLLLAVPAGVASLLIGPGVGFVAAGLLSAAVVGTLLLPVPMLPGAVVGLTVIFVSVIVLLLWIATYPLHMAMHWALTGYEQARRQTAQAREHRAQLMHLAKELEGANQRLKSMAFELERARQAANEARRLKAEFAANISHELRTPLNLIIGFSEMMALASHVYGTALPAAYRGDVQAIYRNARHLSNLIDDVLDLSQIEAGRMGMVKRPTSLAEVVTEAISTVSALFEGHGLALEIDLPSDLPLVEADRTRIRQVLINLLNNAAHFTEQGKVTVAATLEGQDVTVTVADSGAGIAEEDLPSVFEEFRQLDGSIQHRRKGSGLGLAISRKFVELHGGRMWVRSRLGEGTTFFFRLPISSEMGVSHLPAEWETWVRLAPGRDDQRTIAVFNEDPATARLFDRYLDGYQVVSVPNAPELQRLAAQTVIHAIIVVVASGEAGWIQLRQVREGLPSLPVLVCTLRGGAKQIAQAPGVKTYLVKPVSQGRFLAALEKLGEDVHTLLLVDDDPEVVRLLSRMVRLAPRPYRVFKAYGGTQALSLLKERRPDAVVLDLLMPEVDGYTVLEHMQDDDALRQVPVIVISAKGLEDEVITAGLVGVTRREGFSIGEMMRCLKADLDALRPPTLLYTAPTSPATPVE